MGGRELDQYVLAVTGVTAGQARAAAVHVADRIATEHPHKLDDLMPRLAGRQLAADPVIAAGVRELLDALGLATSNQQLKGGGHA